MMDALELTRRREALGLSRADLADAIGVSPVTIWRWETEARQPIPVMRRLLETTLRRLERRQRPAGGREDGTITPSMIDEERRRDG